MITSGPGGTGNGTVTYLVAANPTPNRRMATLTINGDTVTIRQGGTFVDVPPSHPFFTEIGKIHAQGITVGCTSTSYCPDQPTTRQETAAFIIRALHGPGYVPPAPAMQRFQDVPPSNPFYAHIEELAIRGITLGCSANPPLYCPTQNVTRGQMAAFLIRAFPCR